MFALTGVTKPDLDVAGLTALGDHYAALATAAGTAYDKVIKAVETVVESNTGEASWAFSQRVLGSGSITEHLNVLCEAAQRTSAAYRDAASSGGDTQAAMIDLDAERDAVLAWGLLIGADAAILRTLIRVTREDLLRLESAGVGAISQAFAELWLPPQTVINKGDWEGRLDTDIERQWRGLSDEQRKKALQKMADGYAAAHGFPSIKIVFADLPSPPGGTIDGGYRPAGLGPPALALNAAQLADPKMINTVIHEMQHRHQYQGRDLQVLWQHERPGTTRAEVDRWRRLSDRHVQRKGGDTFLAQYQPRPEEVDARRAARDFVNNLSQEEFMEYLK